MCIESAAALAAIVGALRYDRRKRGIRGRVLARALPTWGLAKDDRLEPQAALRDIAGFEKLAAPVTITFWRPTAETRSKHRNPLLGPRLGVSLTNVTVDQLHAFSLGPVLDFVSVGF